MNNFILSIIVVAPALSTILWQNAKISRISEATAAIEASIGERRREFDRMNRLNQETVTEIERAPQSAEIVPGNRVASAPSDISSDNPPPSEFIWNNGKPYVWLEKKLLPKLGVPSFRPVSTFLAATPRLSPEGQDLLMRFTTTNPELSSDVDPMVAFASWAADQPAAIVEEVTAVLRSITSDAVNAIPEYDLDSSAATILGLTVEQVQATQNLVDAFVARIRSLESDRVEVLPQGDIPPKEGFPGAIALRIPSVTEESKALRTELKSSLQAVLGNERAEYWMQMASDTFYSDFTAFDSGERKLTIYFDGQRYHAQEFLRGSSSTAAGSFGTPRLNACWRPFIRKTNTGFEVIR